MSFEEDQDKEYLKDILNEIGTWASDDIEEHFFKNGEEIPESRRNENDISQRTIYYEDGSKKYEISSDGENTQIIEYDSDEEIIEKFIVDSDEILELLGL